MKVLKLEKGFEIVPEKNGIDWFLHQEPVVKEEGTLYKNTLILGYFWKLPKYVNHIGLQVMEVVRMYTNKFVLQFKNGWRIKTKIEIESGGIHIVGICEDILFSKELVKEFYSLIKELVWDIKFQFREEILIECKSNPILTKKYGWLSRYSSRPTKWAV